MKKKKEILGIVNELHVTLSAFMLKAPAFDEETKLAGQLGVLMANLESSIKDAEILDPQEPKLPDVL